MKKNENMPFALLVAKEIVVWGGATVSFILFFITVLAMIGNFTIKGALLAVGLLALTGILMNFSRFPKKDR